MNMFTLFVAYVLAAHYAGRDMSSLQVTALTFLYGLCADADIIHHRQFDTISRPGIQLSPHFPVAPWVHSPRLVIFVRGHRTYNIHHRLAVESRLYAQLQTLSYQ